MLVWCCLQVRVRINDANGCYLDEADGCKFVFAGAKFSIVAGFCCVWCRAAGARQCHDVCAFAIVRARLWWASSVPATIVQLFVYLCFAFAGGYGWW
jgi:hypothetical protein